MTVEAAFDIKKVITPELITLNLKGTKKEEVLMELTDLLVNDGDVIDKDTFFKDVLYRETEGITGIGQGVAIPHGKSSAVKNTTLAVGISDHPIEWETLDENPVDVVILFAVRDQDANTLHIKLLQNVAVLLADDDFINSLHHIKTKEELIKLLGKTRD
ncbi:MAG: PTS sugar transporter subunit IIA [Aerococcus sp.]|nr:PTS sugar transporter subunit IIA [Aerococcus sp.]